MIRPLLRLICGTRLLKHKRGKLIDWTENSAKQKSMGTYECPRCYAQWTRKRKGKA